MEQNPLRFWYVTNGITKLYPDVSILIYCINVFSMYKSYQTENEIRDGAGGGFNERQNRVSAASVEVDEDGFDDFGRRVKKEKKDRSAKEAAALARLQHNYGFLSGDTGSAGQDAFGSGTLTAGLVRAGNQGTVESGQFDDANEIPRRNISHEKKISLSMVDKTTRNVDDRRDDQRDSRHNNTSSAYSNRDDRDRDRDRSRDHKTESSRTSEKSRVVGDKSRRSLDRSRSRSKSKDREYQSRDRDRDRDRQRDSQRDSQKDRTRREFSKDHERDDRDCRLNDDRDRNRDRDNGNGRDRERNRDRR